MVTSVGSCRRGEIEGVGTMHLCVLVHTVEDGW